MTFADSRFVESSSGTVPVQLPNGTIIKVEVA
jgi:hypothetical protein